MCICVYILSWWLIGRNGVLRTLSHGCGFHCQQTVLKHFSSPGYHHSKPEYIYIYIYHLYIHITYDYLWPQWLCGNPWTWAHDEAHDVRKPYIMCPSSRAITKPLSHCGDIHIYVCSIYIYIYIYIYICSILGSLTMAFTGKFV